MHVQYDEIAPHYDARYDANPLADVTDLLERLAGEAGGAQARVLEVGCGTGHWLAGLGPRVARMAGLDLSAGMLRQARRKAPAAPVVQGQAGALPFANESFDLVVCVNALHHFPDRRAFLAEALRRLRPGGLLVNIGMDPHAGRERWYVYDYFPGTLETDRQRFASVGTLVDWALAAGFERATGQVAQHIHNAHHGRAVLDDPFLRKGGTSQLALLSDEAYQAGLARMRLALDAAEAAGEVAVFEYDLWLWAMVAVAPGRR